MNTDYSPQTHTEIHRHIYQNFFIDQTDRVGRLDGQDIDKLSKKNPVNPVNPV
jgi:hypothetical protein